MGSGYTISEYSIVLGKLRLNYMYYERVKFCFELLITCNMQLEKCSGKLIKNKTCTCTCTPLCESPRLMFFFFE